MTEFEVVKDNLPKIDITAYSETREAIQRIVRQYHRFFLGKCDRRWILYVDSINIINDVYIEVTVSCYKSDGRLQSTELVMLDRGLVTDEEKLKEAIIQGAERERA